MKFRFVCPLIICLCLYGASVFAETWVYTKVKTPKNSEVVVYTRSPDFTPTQKAQAAQEMTTLYPNVIKLRDATNKYNCHSYAWYSTSTTNSYWMNDPAKYMSDGSYMVKAEPAAGRKIYYPTIGFQHSGILISTTKVQSKWGDYGLYEHLILDTPYTKSTNRVAFYQ